METIRNESLKYCIGFTTLIALALLYAGIWSVDPGAPPGVIISSSMKPVLWVVCVLYFAGAFLSGSLMARSTQLASWILCSFAGAGIFVIISSYSNPYSILGFLLPILFSVFLFDWKQMAMLTGLLLAAYVASNIVYFHSPFAFGELLMPWMIVLAISTFIMFTINPLYAMIDWYEKKYVTAHLNEQIIKDNEIKLERLVRSLNETQKYLRTTNDLLIKARDEAEIAKNAKQVFVQTVSHELRTPLNLIIGFSETMVHTPYSYGNINWTPELRGDIECIFQSSQHLKSLIDDVLELAALENKKYEIEPSVVGLRALILEVVLITEVAYQSKGLSLEKDLLDDSLMVLADGVRIKQVLLNLLSNALKYTTQGGVLISARRGEDMARVTVQDTGKGIPEDALDKVFEAFYQVDKSNSREDSGTGLGLSISKQLIELHGGEMSISSMLNKGTTVFFTVPLAK